MAKIESLALLLSIISLVSSQVVTDAKKAPKTDGLDKSQEKKGKSKLDPKYTVTEEAWFEIEVRDYDGFGEDLTGKVVIALFGETCPTTVMNFQSLAKGYRRGSLMLHYKNTPVHRVVQDFVIQMGDVKNRDGTGGESIYGPSFTDENYEISHNHVGMVSMANHGKDTNGSQFFIVLTKARWLDNKHVAFGIVKEGMDLVQKIADIEIDKNTGMPIHSIKILDSGVNQIKKKYIMSEDMLSAFD